MSDSAQNTKGGGSKTWNYPDWWRCWMQWQHTMIIQTSFLHKVDHLKCGYSQTILYFPHKACCPLLRCCTNTILAYTTRSLQRNVRLTHYSDAHPYHWFPFVYNRLTCRPQQKLVLKLLSNTGCITVVSSSLRNGRLLWCLFSRNYYHRKFHAGFNDSWYKIIQFMRVKPWEILSGIPRSTKSCPLYVLLLS